MRRSLVGAVLVLAAASSGGADAGQERGPQRGQGGGVLYLATDVRDGRTLAEEGGERLDRVIVPGSVLKIAALAAALESGIIGPQTAILCPRVVRTGGHTLRCSHPDLRRPFRAAEALAHSCNGFFAALAARLTRASLDEALARLGLARSNAATPVTAAAVGIDGVRASPRELGRMMTRLAVEPEALRWRPETLRLIREGLAGAAQYGTASAFGAAKMSALAKTGTVVVDGRSQGVVVGLTPADAPSIAFVLVGSGVSGAQAAELAVTRLRALTRAAHNDPDAARPDRSGALRIGIAGQDGRYTPRDMPLEDYVAGVVAGEAEGSRPAALQALAITVRTFALANRGRHAANGFDLCDLTHCQVLRPSSTLSRAAAEATRGRVLLYNGEPASIFYSASCGGFTQRPSAVWSGAKDVAFLPSRRDDAHPVDRGGTARAEWSATIPAADLTRVLRAGGYGGDIVRDLRVIERDTSGRVAWVRVAGMTPDRVSGNDLRALTGRLLGWQHLKSTAFDVRREGAGYRFTGRGAGHGVGLCVVGASRRAARGESAEAILQAYFPGLRIGNGAQGAGGPHVSAAEGAEGLRAQADAARSDTLIIVIPESDQRERDAIEADARRTRDRLRSVLGVVQRRPIRVRFHSTVESYVRATGQPWFTAGATRGDDIHLLPPTVLRQRGVLDRTVAHELVHVLTRDVLTGRPRWLLEGAAVYFADPRATLPPQSGAKAAPSACPDDREFVSPASASALANAYSRAERCFVAGLQSGANWMRVD